MHMKDTVPQTVRAFFLFSSSNHGNYARAVFITHPYILWKTQITFLPSTEFLVCDLQKNLMTLVYFNCEEHVWLFNNEEQKYFYNSLDEIKT